MPIAPRRSHTPTATLAAAALLGAGAWLARPTSDRDARPTRPPLRAVLLDSSASAVALRPDWRASAVRALAEEARAAEAAGEDILVVAYAGEVARTFVAGRPALLLERLAGRGDAPFQPLAALPGAGAALGTDLAGALAVAAEALAEPGRPPGRVIVIGEGTATDDGPTAAAGRGLGGALAHAAAHAVELRCVPLPPPARGDLELVALDAPRSVPEGTPLALDLALAWRPPGSGAGPGAITFEVRRGALGGPLGALARETTVDVFPARASDPAQRLRAAARVVLEPLPRGVHTLSVRARPSAGADPLPHDDEVRVTVRVGDSERVLAVVRDSGLAAHLAGPFAGVDGGALGSVALQRIELDDLARALPGADVLLTVGVSLAALPADALRAHLAGGGGWLHAAGAEFLRIDGGALGAELALVPADDERPPRDVVFLVDGSGSMRGELWTRVQRALCEVVPEVRLTDAVLLRFFNRMLDRVVLETRSDDAAERLAALTRVLRVKAPGGATDVIGVLDAFSAAAAADVATRRDRRGLVILLTDGISDSVTAWAADARARLTEAGYDLRVVQIGDDEQGRRFLQRLLWPGEEVLRGGALEGLAEQLRDELHAERLVEGAALVPAASALADGAAPSGAGASVRSVARALAQGAAEASPAPPWAPLERAVRAELAPGARAVWTTPEGEPVLALVERGAGWAATLVTLPTPGWCTALAAHPERLAPTLLALAEHARERTRRALYWSAVEGRAGDSVDVVGDPFGADGGPGLALLDGADPAWPAALELVVWAPVRQGAEGGPDTGWLPTDPPASELARVPLVPAPLPGAPHRRAARLGAALQRGRETLAAGVIDPRTGAVLERLALAPLRPAEGTLRERPIEAWPAPTGARPSADVGPHPAAPWFLALGAAWLALLHFPWQAWLPRPAWRRRRGG